MGKSIVWAGNGLRKRESRLHLYSPLTLPSDLNSLPGPDLLSTVLNKNYSLDILCWIGGFAISPFLPISKGKSTCKETFCASLRNPKHTSAAQVGSGQHQTYFPHGWPLDRPHGCPLDQHPSSLTESIQIWEFLPLLVCRVTLTILILLKMCEKSMQTWPE